VQCRLPANRVIDAFTPPGKYSGITKDLKLISRRVFDTAAGRSWQVAVESQQLAADRGAYHLSQSAAARVPCCGFLTDDMQFLVAPSEFLHYVQPQNFSAHSSLRVSRLLQSLPDIFS